MGPIGCPKVQVVDLIFKAKNLPFLHPYGTAIIIPTFSINVEKWWVNIASICLEVCH